MNEYVQAGIEVGKIVGTGVVAAGPLTKLIEVVSAGIGMRYKPRAMRNEADAKAYELQRMTEAEGKASLIKADADNELAQRTAQRLYHREMQRQVNVENVVEYASQSLSETMSDVDVDEDWRTRFFNKVQDVTSDDMQKIWGKILANEVNKPGEYSLRTLDVLSNLTKQEAELFNTFCSLCVRPGQIIRFDGFKSEKYDLYYADIMQLREAGLVDTSNDLTANIPATPTEIAKNQISFEFRFLDKGFIVHKQDRKTYNTKVFALTSSGRELFMTLEPAMSEMYYQDLRLFFLKHHYRVYETRRMYELIKNSYGESN